MRAKFATLRHVKRVPRHHVRLPDERARLRAHEGHARVARLRARRPSATTPTSSSSTPARSARRPTTASSPTSHEAKTLKRHDPERIIGVGGCWAQSVKDAGLPPVPVRRRRVRPRPGPQARRVPDQRQPHRPGLLRVRGLHRPPAGQARARLPGLGADLRRLQHEVRVLHRARRRAGARCRRPLEELVAEIERARRRRRPRGHAARPERQLLRHAPAPAAAPLLRAARRGRRDRGHRPHPLHQPAPRAHERGRDPRPRGAAEPSASTSTCRCSPAARGSSRRCAAPTTASRYMDRVALIREHVPDCALTTDIIVGFPGETEADFEETLEVAEEVGYDGAFTFIYSPRRGTEAADAHRRLRPARGGGRAHGAARRGRPAPRARARPAVRRPHARRPRRGHLAHRRQPRSAAAPATTRSSTSTASRRRARSSRSRSPPPRARRSPARCRCSPARG